MARFKSEETLAIAFNLGVGAATMELFKAEKDININRLVTNDGETLKEDDQYEKCTALPVAPRRHGFRNSQFHEAVM